MKIAYFDCFSGISGDMILGALIDAGLDLKELDLELRKLKISGFKLKAEKTEKLGISGTKFKVDVTEHHVERHLKDMIEIVDQSELSDDVKNLSKKIFKELARAEAKIHNKNIEEIHFHEVGGLDSIVDVIGSLIGIEKLGIEGVHSSKVHVGTGFVECEHGTIPVPAPATLELLKEIPIYSKGIKAELVTPTGACILKTLSKSFGVMPEMKMKKIGYGAGSRDLEIPNLLRVYIGETNPCEYEEDEVILIETNLDDMSP
ncbi:MAG: nickel pincer cofactor biosynthesis protein LarC, partial [candidate division Zixibacteria bacterium]|nr:nickel pincer cofactor biosynthesis protein LarC [candidate division Zixibacteria bacterium]